MTSRELSLESLDTQTEGYKKDLVDQVAEVVIKDLEKGYKGRFLAKNLLDVKKLEKILTSIDSQILDKALSNRRLAKNYSNPSDKLSVNDKS